MKQEATKKSKKLLWLWIVLAALVLIVGAVIGAIMIFGGEEAPTAPPEPPFYPAGGQG